MNYCSSTTFKENPKSRTLTNNLQIPILLKVFIVIDSSLCDLGLYSSINTTLHFLQSVDFAEKSNQFNVAIYTSKTTPYLRINLKVIYLNHPIATMKPVDTIPYSTSDWSD